MGDSDDDLSGLGRLIEQSEENEKQDDRLAARQTATVTHTHSKEFNKSLSLLRDKSQNESGASVDTSRSSSSDTFISNCKPLSPQPDSVTDKTVSSSPKTSHDNTPEKDQSVSNRELREQTASEKTPEKRSSTDRDKTPGSKEKSHIKPETSLSSHAGPSDSKKKKHNLSEEDIQKLKKQDEDRMKMQVLVSNFSEEQLNRYEMFRRATFPKAAIKRRMQEITGTTVSQTAVIAMSGISKVFVGEVMETALDVMEKWGESGPLQPKHLREAVRILRSKNMIPSTKSKNVLF